MSNWDFSGLFWKVLRIKYFRKQHWRSCHFSNIDTTCLYYIIHRWSHTTNVILRFACRPALQIYKNNDRLPFVIYRRHIWRNIFRNLMSLTDVLIYIYMLAIRGHIQTWFQALHDNFSLYHWPQFHWMLFQPCNCFEHWCHTHRQCSGHANHFFLGVHESSLGTVACQQNHCCNEARIWRHETWYCPVTYVQSWIWKELRWVRIELTTLGLWDLRAANCAITAW